MLAVFAFCSLIVATVTNSPTAGISDKGKRHLSLVPSLLTLERTVALLSAKLESKTALLSAKLESNTAPLSSKLDSNTALLSAKLESNTALLFTKLEPNTALLSAKPESNIALMSAKLESNTALLSNNTAEISSMKSELQGKDSKLPSFARSLAQLKTDVAFEASLPSDTRNVRDNVRFKFSNVPYNRGGGYRKSSGIFTAPVPGTYMFWASIMNDDSKKYLNVFMFKDGVNVARSATAAGTRWGVASISTGTNLKQGNQVWFQKHGSTNLRGDNWFSYGGALLRAS